MILTASGTVSSVEGLKVAKITIVENSKCVGKQMGVAGVYADVAEMIAEIRVSGS
jgi:hypothetical protein